MLVISALLVPQLVLLRVNTPVIISIRTLLMLCWVNTHYYPAINTTTIIIILC